MTDIEHKMYVTGDCHGEEARMIYRGFPYNGDLGNADILFCCGDWGYISNDSFLDYLAEEKPYTICWIDGNHEKFDLINSYPVEMWNGGKVHIIRRDKAGKPKIIHLMRGQIFTIHGVKIFTFGGAYSIDKHMRTPGISWWEQEMPTKEEMEEGMKNLEANNYEVDVILSHTLPETYMCRYHPFHEPEKRLNDYLEEVRKKANYKHWYMGHLHRDEEVGKKDVILWFNVRDMLTGELMEELM